MKRIQAQNREEKNKKKIRKKIRKRKEDMFSINFVHLNGTMQNETALSFIDCFHTIIRMVECMETELTGSLSNENSREMPFFTSYLQNFHHQYNRIEENHENFLTDLFDMVVLWAKDFHEKFIEVHGDVPETHDSHLFQLQCAEYEYDSQLQIIQLRKQWMSFCL